MPARSGGRGRAKLPPRSQTPGRTAGARKLREYRAKRQFESTPEPEGRDESTPGAPRFTIQKHDATRLHYDLRLEVEGVLKSWAVPKGPSLDPKDRRLAVRTEDHPVEYLTFEGVIPDGHYGAGPMIVWDTGTYRSLSEDRSSRRVPIARAIEGGKVKIWLEGKKLRGGFALIRTGAGKQQAESGKEQWFLIKHKDEHATTGDGSALLEERPESVSSGKTIDDLGRRKRGAHKTAANRAKKHAAVSTADAVTSPAPAGRGREKKPTWVEPMLATLVNDAPDELAKYSDQDGPVWAYEHKYDGFRALAFRDGGRLRLLSRNQKNLADRFPEIPAELLKQPLEDFIVDGEIIAIRGGKPSFSELQKRLRATTLQAASRSGVQLCFVAFDLLYAAGHDARGLPLEKRKELLKRALVFNDVVLYSEHTVAQGRIRGGKLLERVCRDGGEGLIAKRLSDAYIPGRSRSWLKLKCSLRQEFVIGGYTDPQGSRAAFGALLIGYYKDDRLVYAGKVGTGFTDKLLRELLDMVRPLERKTSPFAPDPQLPRRGVHFVQPTLVAEVAFSEWTHDDHVRHPRFLGVRPDKDPAQVGREQPASL